MYLLSYPGSPSQEGRREEEKKVRTENERRNWK
jgi:hypothetical protein